MLCLKIKKFQKNSSKAGESEKNSHHFLESPILKKEELKSMQNSKINIKAIIIKKYF